MEKNFPSELSLREFDRSFEIYAKFNKRFNKWSTKFIVVIVVIIIRNEYTIVLDR